MSLVGFKAQNHTQQTAKRGARDDVDDRGTEWSFIHEVEEKIGARFGLDVAAASHNHKAPAYYTREQDGLSLPWTGVVWCNPPYSDCGSWVRKAWTEWEAENAAVIAMLLPANRVEQSWWQDHVEPFRDRPGSPLRVEFLRGRMRFDRPGVEIGPKGDRPPFGCALLIWDAAVTR
jgi:phage N-6-adenine-methyltransferase